MKQDWTIIFGPPCTFLQAIILIILPKKILDLLLYKQISVMTAIFISFFDRDSIFFKKSRMSDMALINNHSLYQLAPDEWNK